MADTHSLVERAKLLADYLPRPKIADALRGHLRTATEDEELAASIIGELCAALTAAETALRSAKAQGIEEAADEVKARTDDFRNNGNQDHAQQMLIVHGEQCELAIRALANPLTEKQKE